MASEHFWYNPTTGNGSTQVSVSADTTNSTHADKVSTITFTAGSASKTVTVRQKYMPYKQQFASTTFPATGGDIYFTVHSDYDVVFRSVPDWITISREGTVYSQGQRISSGVVDNKTFTLTAEENTGASRTVNNTMNMGHYIGDTLQSNYDYFSFHQDGAVAPPNITLSPIYIEVGSAATSTTITMSVNNCTFDHMTTSSAGSFTIVASNPVNNIITLTFPATTSTAVTRASLSFYLYDTDGNAYAATIAVVRAGKAQTKDMALSPTGDTVTSASSNYTIVVMTTACTFNGMTYTGSNADFPVTAVKDGNNIRLTYSTNTGTSRSTVISFTLRDENNNPYYKSFSLTQEAATIERKWYINNNTDLNLYGSISTTNTGISITLLAGEEVEMTESTPVYITDFGVVANPMPSSPENIVITLTNTETGHALGGVFNGSAWVSSGNLTVNEGDTLSLDRT